MLSFIQDHWSDILSRGIQHAWLAGLPLLIGLLISLPLGWLARRAAWLRVILVGGSSLLYTIPSLALFVLIPLVAKTKIIDPTNVIIAMTIYTIALLVRTVADALGAVSEETTQAAIAMGYTPIRRFFGVELPLAVPVISAGLRVAAVSNVAIVSVSALLGIRQLGFYLTDGYQINYWAEVWTGIAACLVLALIFDVAIQLVTRVLTPWQREVGA
ncbi:ABC transporter permease [Flexivirga oryzae]|uniref:Osmoprotectant transport system permease protein n=1 Tax=Flexivirga oryzae TaxID=1794944 RepID=A0A839N9X7_9MICO|nr:ABC transporter permease subunit [Flexivirga oryzae]MBB2894027.1 osmoprotectant transport system permease protein [Flexivirga oryzae]